jgi:hypothetical protein
MNETTTFTLIVRSTGDERSARVGELLANTLNEVEKLGALADIKLYPPLPFPCCEHCGCEADDRIGHDDSCWHGCNDQEAV